MQTGNQGHPRADVSVQHRGTEFTQFGIHTVVVLVAEL